jgi:hypothetical protein
LKRFSFFGGDVAAENQGGNMARFEVLEEYIESQRSEIEAGNPVVIEIRDLDTFERLVTRSIVAPPGRDLEGGVSLTVRNLAENIVSDAWKICILEELDPESVDIKPQSDYRKSAPPGA